MTEALKGGTAMQSVAACTIRPALMEWAGTGAGIWTLGYTALKLYWALGGTALRSTIGFPDDLWRTPWFIVLGLWGTVALGVLGTAVTLALAWSWHGLVPRWLLRSIAWVAAAVLVLRSLVGFIESGLRVAGIGGTTEHAVTWDHWNLILYSPYFFVWGALYGATAWLVGRVSPEVSS